MNYFSNYKAQCASDGNVCQYIAVYILHYYIVQEFFVGKVYVPNGMGVKLINLKI